MAEPIIDSGAQPGIVPIPSVPTNKSPENFDDIALGGLSLRGYIAFLLILTVCVLAFMGKTVDETVKTMALVTLGFYFSNKSGK